MNKLLLDAESIPQEIQDQIVENYKEAVETAKNELWNL